MSQANHLQAILERICTITGDCTSETQAKEKGKENYLYIEYNSVYGGYRLVRVKVDTGAHCNPFPGMTAEEARHSAKIMSVYLHGILIGLQIEKPVAQPTKPEPIDFTRINNDTNGNPRYVVHFLTFITEKDQDNDAVRNVDISYKYGLALSRSRKLGGSKFNNKQYGGGIVFQSYNTDQLQKDIFELMEQYK